MSATSLTFIESLAALIPDGALLAVPKETSGVAMAATGALYCDPSVLGANRTLQFDDWHLGAELP